MKLLPLFLFTATIAVAQNAQPRISVVRLSSNVYQHISYRDLADGKPFPSNGMLIVGKSGALLVDTPWGEDETTALLDYVRDSLNTRVTHCIVTHFHDDSTEGMPVLKRNRIEVIAGQRTAEKLRDSVDRNPDRILQRDEEHLKFGDISVIAFYPGAGHTTDNIVVFEESTKFLFGGCFVKSVEAQDLGNIADADLGAWPASIERVKKRFDQVLVVPGHQKNSSADEALDHTLNLLGKK